MEVMNPYMTRPPKQVPVSRNQLRNEISSSESSILSSYNIKKYNPDQLVAKKGLRVYQDMKTDDQIKASLTVKKFARLSTGWDIIPGDETNKQSVEMADFIRYVFAKMKGTFNQDLLNILTAIEYGYSLSEKVFGIYNDGTYEGKIGLLKLGSREPFGYDFKTDEHNNIIGVVSENINSMSNRDSLGSAENPYPPEKFVIYSYNPEHGNPYGTSDLRAAYPAWWSKKLNIKWWNIFNERFGMPTVVAKYPAKGKGLSKDAIIEIDSILNNLQARSGFRIPDNITFELLEAQRQGKVTYGEAISMFDGMIARSILVPNLLGLQEQKSVGSYALGKKHFDVFLFVLDMLGSDIEENIVGEQIIRPLVSMNFGEVPMEILPKFQFESLAEDQTEARSQVVKVLADAGLIDKREEWVREYLNIPERDLEKYPHQHPVGEVNIPVIPKIPDTEDPDIGDKKPDSNPGSLPAKIGDKDDIPAEGEGNPAQKMSLSREPNKYEQKVNFEALDAEMTFLVDSLTTGLEPILTKWRDDLLKKADKLLREKDLAGTVKLQIKGVGEFKTTLRDVLVKTHLDSKLHGMEELIIENYPATIKRRFGLMAKMDFQVEPWEPVPPQEALDYFNRKVIVTINKDGFPRKTLPLARMAELSYYDKRAFTISGIESEYVLGRAKLLIERGIKDGLLKETMNGLRGIFSQYIGTGEIRDGKLITASRLETIARTNISEAVNAGRMAMYKDPEIGDFVPYLEWSSILDSRVTDYCEHMDGKIFKKDEVAPPPAHFNCRSTVVPVTKPEIEREGGVEVANWEKESSKEGRGIGFKKFNSLTTKSQILKMRLAPLDPINQDIIVRCPNQSCGSEEIIETKNDLGTRTFLCIDCKLQFRVTQFGNLYIYEPGVEQWVRQTITRSLLGI